MAGLACAVLLALTPAGVASLAIGRPNFGVPAFSETGGVFRVEIKAAAGLDSNQWTAVLVNDLSCWTGTVEQAEYGAYADNNSTNGYRLTVRAPPGIPPEVFRLAVSHPAGGTATNRNAVSILPCIETNFYIFHYADPQGESYEPNVWDTGMYNTHGSIRELFWHAPAVRLANPRFLFDTGDELDNNYATSVARYEQYKDGMCEMGVAVLATRGNNDKVSGFATTNWRSTVGVESYSVVMGSFYICQKDYNENNFTTWFTNDYAASFTNPAIRYRLFGQHFNSGGCAWLPPVGQYPDLMLVGHGHVNSTLQSSPYYIIESQQACNKGAVGFFEFTSTGTNWLCSSLTNLPAAQFQLMSSGPTSKLTCAYACANDGTAYSNTAVIANSLSARFWDGRVRFLMKNLALGYQITNGVALAEYTYNNRSNLAVLVKVNIAPSATTTVALWRTDADEDGMADSWETSNFGDLATASADTDFDQDGLRDWQEYVAGTLPKDARSVLRMEDTRLSSEANGFVIRWSSISNRCYTIFGATNLMQAFQILTQSVAATPPQNTYTDTVHAVEDQFFYRVGVQEP